VEEKMNIRRARCAVPLALVALVVIISAACSGDDETSGEQGQQGLDPMLLDYVYPTNGDAGVAARLQFEVGVAQASGEGIADCLADKGYPGSYSAVVDHARFWAEAMETLPPLARIAEEGMGSGPPQAPQEFMAAMLECRSMDTSKADVWSEEIRKLKFSGSVKKTRATIGAVEATSVGEEARACMVEAGAPTETDPNSGPSMTFYMWASTADAMFSGGREDAGPSPEVQAYVRCVRPFYDEVERRLEKPRRDFVEKHRDELLELQAEYATFGP
jgi:hypothetical protein